MKNIYRLILSIVITIFFFNPAKADTTYVSGDIVNQNWTIAGSPYVVTNDVRVVRLFIDPGVSVLFAGNYEFLVEGVIEAVGTEQSKISFTTKSGVSSWKGIRFQNSSTGSYLKWCIVEKANNSGIRVIDSPPNLYNCIIRNNQSLSSGGGIFISNFQNQTVYLTDCIISNNLIPPGNLTYGGGIRVITNGLVRITRCKIENNSITTSTHASCLGGGASIAGNTQFIKCTIKRNAVIGIGNSGAYGGGVFVDSGNVSFTNCIINENKCTGTGGFSVANGGGIYNEGNTSIFNSIIANDTVSAGDQDWGSGIYTYIGQLKIENSTIAYNKYEAIYNVSSNVSILNSIIFFSYYLGNNMYGPQVNGSFNITYSDIQGGFSGMGNINLNPSLNSCLKILSGSPCIDAGKDSIVYRDVCFPPSLGNLRNDMGSNGGPGACNWLGVPDTCYQSPVSSINIELTALMEGLYNPVSNLMIRPQVERMYLRNATSPYAILEPAAATLGQNGISTTEFIFNSAPSGTYYLVIKNWNNLETWSKVGGELLYNDGETNYYDFTSSSSQAYGNNLKLIGSKWCTYSGAVTPDSSIDLADVLQINAASNAFTAGYNINDLNGDNQVNLTDLLIVYNNSAAFTRVRNPFNP